MRWDIFCKVIDNHGDAGVCWRLARELARRAHTVRLWIDDPSPLAWMAPQGEPGVEVIAWADSTPARVPGDVVVEAFGCDPPPAFVEAMARRSPAPVWINLEYLSAEAYVERSHALPSPVMSGPGAGLTKFFFYPGFTARTGGLLRERDLASRQAAFDGPAWLRSRGIDPDAGPCLSLFCYEPPALGELLDQLASGPGRTQLLVTPGRPAAAMDAALGATHRQALRQGQTQLHIHRLELMPQPDYDHLLWSCDLNFVRGEDSVVRALWAGRPFVWHIYPQHDDAHHDKLAAFLDWLAPTPDWREFHRVWNGVSEGPLPPLHPAGWRAAAQAATLRATALPELAAALEGFAGERSRI